jgi:hypothetical protein
MRTSTEAEDNIRSSGEEDNMRTSGEEDQRADKAEAGGDTEAGDRRKRKRRMSLRRGVKRRKGEGKIA